jgi:hypothetical protein
MTVLTALYRKKCRVQLITKFQSSSSWLNATGSSYAVSSIAASFRSDNELKVIALSILQHRVR